MSVAYKPKQFLHLVLSDALISKNVYLVLRSTSPFGKKDLYNVVRVNEKL